MQHTMPALANRRGKLIWPRWLFPLNALRAPAFPSVLNRLLRYQQPLRRLNWQVSFQHPGQAQCAPTSMGSSEAMFGALMH
jgi:hypothetical protein